MPTPTDHIFGSIITLPPFVTVKNIKIESPRKQANARRNEQDVVKPSSAPWQGATCVSQTLSIGVSERNRAHRSTMLKCSYMLLNDIQNIVTLSKTYIPLPPVLGCHFCYCGTAPQYHKKILFQTTSSPFSFAE